MTKKAKKQGFTLVEIMIVVAIIGLLAAIGIPSFAKARTNAREKACINNLRMIDAAKEQWAMAEDATSADAPAATDLDAYIKGTTAALICKEGGTSFADSYTINNIDTAPACQLMAGTHKLP